MDVIKPGDRFIFLAESTILQKYFTCNKYYIVSNIKKDIYGIIYNIIDNGGNFTYFSADQLLKSTYWKRSNTLSKPNWL